MKLLILAFACLLVLTNRPTECLYYDGLSSYSIYPRLDLHLCHNSSLSFDFTVSANKFSSLAKSTQSAGPKLLLFARQQGLQDFSVKLTNENNLQINDFWSTAPVSFKLPADYMTSWFRLVYSRRQNTVDITLFKFEENSEPQDDKLPELVPIFSKQKTLKNYVSASTSSSTYSQLLVGGMGDELLKNVNNFHGYILNLQYTSDNSGQCMVNDVCLMPDGQRHYAIFSSSSSKKHSSKQSLMIDDICESDMLVYDMCPKDCACFSNNFKAPFFSCECQSEDGLLEHSDTEQCSLMFKSLEINFDDSVYFKSASEIKKFEYPMVSSFTRVVVQSVGTVFDAVQGLGFRSPSAHVNLDPAEDFLDSDTACFWNLENCESGFLQHMILSVELLDESRFQQKVVIMVNGKREGSKLVGYIHQNRLHFSVYDTEKKIEWLVSSPILADKYLNRPIKITLTWLRNKSISLHMGGFIVDSATKPLVSPVNLDIYSASHILGNHAYEIGIKPINSNSQSTYSVSHLDLATASALINHQFTLKHMRREYYNDPSQYEEKKDGPHDSKIIVSSPLPSEIIRIDNTQRVMYKIDSPLTGVTNEAIDLAFRTSEADGVVFYITNNPIVSYFELVNGLPVAVIDTRYKNVNLRPQTSPRLDDNRWHEVKLHRDNQKIGITIDSQYYDSEELGPGYNQILTGGHVYLGIADPTNINLSHKKAFKGEMVRGKVTINNVQQKVEQQPYDQNGNIAWHSSSSSASSYSASVSGLTENQTINIDTTKFVAKDGIADKAVSFFRIRCCETKADYTSTGKNVNIIINVYGPPGFSVNGVQAGSSSSSTITSSSSGETADTHYIYLDKLPNTRFVSVASTDVELDFRVTSSRLDQFLIKFQTRRPFGQLVTLINNRNNFVGLEVYNGYVYSSTAYNGKISRNQISRVRVDDGRIYQVNMKQEQEKLLCWLDADDSYKSSILFYEPININKVRLAGNDQSTYGFSSQHGFVGCIGAVILNERDVIDVNYAYVPSNRKQSCEKVIEVENTVSVSREPMTTTPPPYIAPQPIRPPSLGYISFSGQQDILTYNFFYDHEKPNFEDISFIFRTVTPYGILFSAHNDDNHHPNLIGAYLKDGRVHVVYLNSTSATPQDLHFSHTRVDDGSLYRLNIRRHNNGQGFIQLQSYETVKALDFHTESGKIKLTKILVGGADQFARNRFFATRPDFTGCIIDLFQINGNSVIKPAEIPQARYNCQIDMSKHRPTSPPTNPDRSPKCLPQASSVSFSRVSDAITYQHETSVCDHINIPFRTRHSRGILYSHSSNDGRFFIVVYLRRGFLNLLVRDSTGTEKEIELSSQRVDDGQLHKLDINCENGFLVAYIDQNRQVQSNRLDLDSPLYFNTYTIGYFNPQVLATRFSRLDNFQGCVEQILFNDECLIHESHLNDRSRLSCDVSPVQPNSVVEVTTTTTTQKTGCTNMCSDEANQCVVELDKNSYMLFNAHDVGVSKPVVGSAGSSSIRLKFKVLDVGLKDQELITVFNYDRSIRVYLDNGLPVVELRGQKFSKLDTRYNDGEWHELLLEKQVDGDLFVQVDEKSSAVHVPFDFDLYGNGRVYFGSTVGVDSYFRGLLRQVFVKYGNVEYDVVSLSVNEKVPGVTCAGNVLIRGDKDVNSVDNSKKNSLSNWRFRGQNSGDLEFVPYLPTANKAELSFHFNTTTTNANIMCTKDDILALNAELVDSILAVSITDIRTRRVLQTVNCRPKQPSIQFNDNSPHKVQIFKKGVNQFEVICDDQEPQALYFRQRHGEDVPFIATKYGVSFGRGCFEQNRKFKGELSQIVYNHDGLVHTFDDLQYSEDPRFSYEGYVEFRPEFITQVYADPKPIAFRSRLSAAKIPKWDQVKLGHFSFEFRQEITGQDGFLFSTDHQGAYFAIAINDGFLESILSPKANSRQDYDRFQRLFPNRVNDANWHRLEFTMSSDNSIGSFVLDEDLTAKIRFPLNYWSEQSPLVFGNNADIERSHESFRGCLRNTIVNSRLVDWADTGSLVNIEAGCYNYKFPGPVLSYDDSVMAELAGDGCLHYGSSGNTAAAGNKESLEMVFATSSDRVVLVESVGGEFVVYLQGPGIVIRGREDTSSRIVMERGISFNDGNPHRLKLSRRDGSVEMVVDEKFKTDFKMTSRSGQLVDFYLGCGRTDRIKVKLVELESFKGTLAAVSYSLNDKVTDLVKSLSSNAAPLVDGRVVWSGEKTKQRIVSTDSVSFKNSRSFLKLENLNFDIGSSLKFLFKTNEPSGLLGLITPSTPFYSTSQSSRNLVIPNYIAIELLDGIPSLLINLGNQKTQRISCPTTKLNDNNWHRIQITRERLAASRTGADSTSSITLSCDDTFARTQVNEEQKFSFSMFTAGNVTGNSEHYLPSDLYHSRNPQFYGCISDFELTGNRLNLYQTTSPDSRETLTNGCQHDIAGLCHTMFRCLNRGECVEGFNRAYCNCEAVSYTGERCEQSASTLTFNGSQGAEYSLGELNKVCSEEVSLRFRTPLRNGVLFAVKKYQNDVVMSISLEDGRIKVVYDRGANEKVVYIGDDLDLFNTNKWHTVSVRRYGGDLDVRVVDNEKNEYQAKDNLGVNFRESEYRLVELGSLNSDALVGEYPNFIGWIQNVKFNGKDLLKTFVDVDKNSHASAKGSAEVGENSLLMHHQLTFTGECPVTVQPAPARSSEKFNVRLYFKTSHPDGVLFFRQGRSSKYAALELSNGILRFVFDLGGGVRVLESTMVLNDKNWHEVTIKRFDRSKFSMRVDEFREALVDSGTDNPQLADLDGCVVGGVTPAQRYISTGLSNKGFMGCLASVEINNEPVDFYSSRVSLCSSVQRGCVDSVCNPNPCSNNGVCDIINNQVSCDCKMTSYSGPLCREDSKFYFFGGTESQAKTCGLVKYTLDEKKVNKESDYLSFGFTTTIANALLIRIESENGDQFMEIQLKGGFVVLSLKINGLVETKEYLPVSGKQFNDNRYYVVQYKRVRNAVTFRLDNFDQLQFDLTGNGAGQFHSSYVYAGSSQENGNFLYCYYGVMSGMVLNGHSILDYGIKTGSVSVVESKYVEEEHQNNSTRFIDLDPDGFCPLGYNKTGSNYLCIFVGCPLYSDFLGDYTCRCYYSFYHSGNGINECKKINETIVEPVLEYNNKLIPAKAMIAETPLGLILGIISGVGLALLAAAIAARKCADGLCIPAKKAAGVAIPLVNTNTVTSTSESNAYNRRLQEQSMPLITRDEQYRSEEYARDTLDFGYRAAPYQQVTEVTEMYEQTLGGPNGTTLVTSILPTTVQTYNLNGLHTSGMHHASASHIHSSTRNLAMDSLYAQGTNTNSAEYELANVTCVTMTPNGKYAIIGQSTGTPQIWDTISGQLIRSMVGSSLNCSNLTLACNGTLLVGLTNDGCDTHAQSLQVWEVQTGKPILMSHQIKCCVFALSADTNSIFMAGNQRFGRGISVGILDLVSNELTKEIKSDPTISFGDNPESIVMTPDEHHAVIGCRSLSGTNFIVFDVTKSSEIAQTRSIALDAEPKCIVALSNNEMVTGTRGGHLIQWSIHTCSPTYTFEDPADMQAHRNCINEITLSSDYEHLVSASSDCTAKVWCTRTKTLQSILAGHHAEVTCASISNNDLVVTGSQDQTVNLWRLHNGSLISSMSVNMNLIEAKMAKHNKTIVAIGEKDGEQQLLMLRVVSVQR